MAQLRAWGFEEAVAVGALMCQGGGHARDRARAWGERTL
jgi:hypothetical protein